MHFRAGQFPVQWITCSYEEDEEYRPEEAGGYSQQLGGGQQGLVHLHMVLGTNCTSCTWWYRVPAKPVVHPEHLVKVQPVHL